MTKLHKPGVVVERTEDATDLMVEQTLTIGNAVVEAIDTICLTYFKAGKPVDLRSVNSALVSVLAHHLAGIPDAADRNRHFAQCGHELADMIAVNVELGTHAQVYDRNPENLQ